MVRGVLFKFGLSIMLSKIHLTVLLVSVFLRDLLVYFKL